MKMRNWFGIVILSAAFAGATVISNVSAVRFGQGIDIRTGGRTAPVQNCANRCVISNFCAAVRTDTADISLFTTGVVWDDFSCGCGGDVYALFSVDTVRKMKNQSTLDFNRPLDPADTAHFSLVPVNTACTLWMAYSTVYSCPSYCNYPPPPVIWYLGKTHEGGYFLFRFVNESTVYDSTAGRNVPVVRIAWILQTDGSLDFSGAPVGVRYGSRHPAAASGSTGRAVRNRAAGAFSGAAFDCRGRRIGSIPRQEMPGDKNPVVFLKDSGSGKRAR